MHASTRTPRIYEPKYGRLLNDFRVGEIYHHPWEVTLDEGLLAIFAASFLDPNPLYSSRRYARELGFADRVVHPMVLMNLALSFSVHDVSEQTIAHLAYLDMKFPNAAYAGDTLSVSSEVLDVRPSASRPDRGVVHVRIVGVNQDGAPVVEFERKALMPAGTLESRAHPAVVEIREPAEEAPAAGEIVLPKELAEPVHLPRWRGRPRGLFEDFEAGDVILHSGGRTVGESEHMQLTVLSRNSHPLHFDEVYARRHGFAGTRVVCGGVVFGWAASLASRDTSASALWEARADNGRHPAPVVAGDTLYAASRVVETRPVSERAGLVRFHLVAVKNETPADLSRAGVELFEGRAPQKVFEIERDLLLPTRAALGAGN